MSVLLYLSSSSSSSSSSSYLGGYNICKTFPTSHTSIDNEQVLSRTSSSFFAACLYYSIYYLFQGIPRSTRGWGDPQTPLR